MAFEPLYIRHYEAGLTESRQNFLLPEDAFPVLQNAYVWRERIKRKNGAEKLGRLRRYYIDSSIGLSGASPWTFNIYSTIVPAITPEANAQIEVGGVEIDVGAVTLIDQGDGTLATDPVSAVTGVINYFTGDVTITGAAGAAVSTITFGYFPGLPCMGARQRQLNGINAEDLIMFDTKYSYSYSDGFEEFVPGTVWTGDDSNFFWTTNWWVDKDNNKIFWATNFSGPTGDPIRFTNGDPTTNWEDFAPEINASADKLHQCLAMLPFRGRMVVFNTWEGQTLANSVQMRQRIRWSAIGNPFTQAYSTWITGFNDKAWKDDIRGQGGFLDIPTSENIVSVGFVRDNLVIYCESSTWQLRYTGLSIAPFQIEKVNTELGAESTFSAVQFDTSLVGIGDKGIVECDSFKSERIDIKIPDLVFQFSNTGNNVIRVHGLRDYFNRLAYWTYPYNPSSEKFPDRRLVYNYENDSWAIFTDSYTCLGPYQAVITRIWEDQEQTWEESDFPWYDSPSLFPANVGGNQQGYVMILDNQTVNQPSLTINGITGNVTTATNIRSVNHNLVDGNIISISNIPTGTPFASSLNDNVFMVEVTDADNFLLYTYNTQSKSFTTPQVDPAGTYVGGGEITVRDNFLIQSKKFNFLEQGQCIHMGYCDVLVNTTNTADAFFSMYVFMEYADEQPVNILPENIDPSTQSEDLFFNSVVPLTSSSGLSTSKVWQRVFCNTRSNFLTIVYTLSDEQMNGISQQAEIEIAAQVLWQRPAGSQINIGFGD